MPLLEWDKNFELGLNEFDEHHKHLVDLLNATYDIFTGKADREALGEVFDKLIDYATYHFAAEEKWMGLRGYSGLKRHREEHAEFCRRIVEIQFDLHRGKTYLSLELLTFLRNWLSDHILRSDTDYARFAQSMPDRILNGQQAVHQ